MEKLPIGDGESVLARTTEQMILDKRAKFMGAVFPVANELVKPPKTHGR